MKFSFQVLKRVPAILFLFGSAALVPSSTVAQAGTSGAPQTPFDRFISHFDLAVSAKGEFTTNASGPVQNTTASNGNLTVRPSTTVGAMATLRAQKSPWVGGEFNFGYSRYTQNFDYTGGQTPSFSGQNTANEFTLGYIAKPEHPVFGFQPFLGGGAGTIEFKPTRNSGSNLPVQARAAYYYTVGGETPLVGDSFGVRVGFRETFYLAPDFGQNYLRIRKLTTSLEPTVGFYLHF